MTTTLYIVRHGATDENGQKIFQGILNSDLTSEGLRQTELLGEYFKDIPIDVAYTSPLHRAKRAMDGILKYHPDIPAAEIYDLHEIIGGELQGLDFDTCNKLYDNIMDTFENNPSEFAAPGGESMIEVYDRMTKTIMDLVKDNRGKTIVISSHATAIQTFLNYAEGFPKEKMHYEFVPNGAVSKFTFDDDWDIHIDYINDTSYMETKQMRERKQPSHVILSSREDMGRGQKKEE